MKLTIEQVAQALGAIRTGHYYRAHCPICQNPSPPNPALSFTGAGERIGMKCHKSNCGFRDIMKEIKSRACRSSFLASDQTPLPHLLDCKIEEMLKLKNVEKTWSLTVPIEGTPAETYLRGRNIDCDLPGSLRYLRPDAGFLPPLGYHEMIAKVEGPNGIALHRTLITGDGKKALSEHSRRQYGRTSGGAVSLREGSDALVVAEGIETALSMMCGLLDGDNSVWSALSTSGLKNLELPERPSSLIISADGDEPGRNAASQLAQRAHDQGWVVSIAKAPNGQDFNDIISNNKKGT